MFTGIVQEVGSVAGLEPAGGGSRMRIAADSVLDGLKTGDSVAVNGACLTATDVGDRSFVADVMAETLRVTGLGRLQTGDAVNLERPLRADGRFDGHIVQGHVDGVGTIRALDVAPNATTVRVSAPGSVLRYCVPKGSVAVDGISLTIVDVTDDAFSVAIIPHTWEVTNMRMAEVGSTVNLEADVLAKYVERLCPGGR